MVAGLGCQQDTKTDTDSEAISTELVDAKDPHRDSGDATHTELGPIITSARVGADPNASHTGPAIFVEPASFDFGEMDQNQARDAQTFIKNVGADTLRIENVRPTCGCTAADLTTTVLAPGESTELQITFNSKKFSGQVSKQVHIVSNDPDHRQVSIVLTADVIVAVKVDPPQQFITNRKIPLGESWSEKVTFSTEVVPELIVELDSYNQKVMDVEIQNRYENDPQKTVMTVTTRSDLIPGAYNDVVKVKTNVPQNPSFTISVRTKVMGNLVVAPGSLNFGLVEGGQELDSSVKVTAAKKDVAFNITKAEIDIPELDVQIEQGDSSQEVTIHISGAALPIDHEKAVTNRGRMMGFLNIYTDLPHEPVLKDRAFYMLRM
jgi:hypothetical protein